MISLDIPQEPVDSIYYYDPGVSLKLNCSVLAGVGDRLVWRLGGVDLPHVDINSLANITLNAEEPVSDEVSRAASSM